MKKILLAALLTTILQAADNDLYDNSISVNLGYGSMAAASQTYSGAVYGFEFNRNLNTSEGSWNIDALQLAVAYAQLNTAARDYAFRIGANALWYIENDTPWTPFVKAGAGLQFIGGTESISAGNYLFGTLGAGLEYQFRGDSSVVGEFADHIAASGENSMRLSVGIKYSFGQSY